MFDKQISTKSEDYMPDYLDLLQANRKLGYNTYTAIADICDNPFDAGATKTDVEITKDENDKVTGIVISDNGKGMSYYELLKSLVPASTGRERNIQNELGCFGVGLVASGLSLGSRIQIYTRGSEGDLYTYLDWNEKFVTNNPVNIVRECTSKESKDILDKRIFGSKTGTVVWISNISIAHVKYDNLVNYLHFHLGVTYYNLRDKYALSINGCRVSPWDYLENGMTHDTSPVYEYKVKRYINGKHVDASIKLQLCYLKRTNDKRPFDFYGTTDALQAGSLERNGRALTYGTWMINRQKSGLYNGLRFRVSYDNTDLDDIIFSINVQKDDCSILDAEFSEWLHKQVNDYWRITAKPIYERNRKKNPDAGNIVLPYRQSGKKLPLMHDRLLAVAEHPLTQKLNSINVDSITNESALNLLRELHSLAVQAEVDAQPARKLKAEM